VQVGIREVIAIAHGQLSRNLMSNRREWNKLHSQSSGLFGDPL